jgi:hypothetical protein
MITAAIAGWYDSPARWYPAGNARAFFSTVYFQGEQRKWLYLPQPGLCSLHLPPLPPPP